MAWEDWTEVEWNNLFALCREYGIEGPEEEIREAALNYMKRGAEGGGNRWGLVGTAIALICDKVEKARQQST